MQVGLDLLGDPRCLAPGLNLDSNHWSGGGINGTPTTAGDCTGTVSADHCGVTDSQAINIAIAGPMPVITSGPPPGATLEAPYSFRCTATGTQPISYRLAAGAFPDGLMLDENSG